MLERPNTKNTWPKRDDAGIAISGCLKDRSLDATSLVYFFLGLFPLLLGGKVTHTASAPPTPPPPSHIYRAFCVTEQLRGCSAQTDVVMKSLERKDWRVWMKHANHSEMEIPSEVMTKLCKIFESCDKAVIIFDEAGGLLQPEAIPLRALRHAAALVNHTLGRNRLMVVALGTSTGLSSCMLDHSRPDYRPGDKFVGIPDRKKKLAIPPFVNFLPPLLEVKTAGPSQRPRVTERSFTALGEPSAI
eukprot:gnl/Dysnectes_brevis/10289_a20169_71.p1 GENE.gnl/Dysnectes_brevis/10289_a20169_71~~gnl/Dysnectes_brevis/10289_a20169_71.p1  ORF type:complete len:245 (+),score=63.47 gnl/Dysnectes_brevis/10289_a20169_71:752-1486(+)